MNRTPLQILRTVQTSRDGTIFNLDEEAIASLVAEGYATRQRVLTEKGRKRLSQEGAPGTIRAVAGPMQF